MGKERRRVVLVTAAEEILGEGLQVLLGQVEDVDLVGPWALSPDIPSRLPEARPDLVVIVDRDLQSPGAVALTGQILAGHPDLPVLRASPSEQVLCLHRAQTLPARCQDLLEVLRRLPTFGWSEAGPA